MLSVGCTGNHYAGVVKLSVVMLSGIYAEWHLC
jgi:hypothetical protein